MEGYCHEGAFLYRPCESDTFVGRAGSGLDTHCTFAQGELEAVAVVGSDPQDAGRGAPRSGLGPLCSGVLPLLPARDPPRRPGLELTCPQALPRLTRPRVQAPLSLTACPALSWG